MELSNVFSDDDKRSCTRIDLPTIDFEDYDTMYGGEIDALSLELRSALNVCKETITAHYHSRQWDSWKRYTNEFELVFTSSSEAPGVGTHTPVSRSFFKLWEILHNFPSGTWDSKEPIRAAFLAEGPGGFVESIVTYRRRYSKSRDENMKDELHGMTLISKNRSVPGWKIAGIADMRVHRGTDGTGDVCKIANIDHFVREVGPSSCDLVTADGGFDFSADFDHQEEASAPLITSEVYAALKLQKVGGALVLKVYDLHSCNSARLLFALRSSYEEVSIVKPKTSRPANSEKYVVCTGFSGSVASVISDLRKACCVGGKLNLKVPRSFMYSIARFNIQYVSRQVQYISKTTRFIKESETWTREQRIDVERRLVLRQLDSSIRWCHDYGINTSPSAIRRYWERLPATQPFQNA